MNKFRNKPIGLIVAENLATAKVFESHEIDFCCHGQQTLEAACQAHHIAIEQLESELSALDKAIMPESPDVNMMSLEELTQHIILVHHTYTKKTLTEIATHLDTVIHVHGGNHPELKELKKEFVPLREEMESHLFKEEQSLFPYIDALYETIGQGTPLPKADFKNIEQPITALEKEHENAGRLLDRIRLLAHDYLPPADACNTYRLLLHKLQALEQDLHIHIAKENYLLFPKAIKLENEAKSPPAQKKSK